MAQKPFLKFKMIFGRLLGYTQYGNLASKHDGINVYDMTNRVARAAITVSAEGASVANQRDITIQLYDHYGQALDYAEELQVINYASSAMLDVAGTGGSTGIAIGANGKILATIVAKKVFLCKTDATGLLKLIYTDTGTDAGYLGVRLAGGRVFAGGTLTNA